MQLNSRKHNGNTGETHRSGKQKLDNICPTFVIKHNNYGDTLNICMREIYKWQQP